VTELCSAQHRSSIVDSFGSVSHRGTTDYGHSARAFKAAFHDTDTDILARTPENVSYMCISVWSVVIGRKSVYDLHSSRWHFQTLRTTEMSMDAFKLAMDVYISYKFGGLLCSTCAVIAAQLCTAGVTASMSFRVISSTSTRGQHICVSLLLANGRHCYAGWAIR